MAKNKAPEATSEKVLPHLIEAEECLIGGILLDPDAISRVVHIVSPEALYFKPHQIIYSVAIHLYEQGKLVNVTLVSATLADRGDLEKVGGSARLLELVDNTISTASIIEVARLIAEKHTRRQLIQLAGKITEVAYSKENTITDALDFAESQIFSLCTKSTNDKDLRWSGDILANVFDSITLSSEQEDGPGIPTGFSDLDHQTQGLQRTDLIILAARPAMGKTAIALNLARNVALAGESVVIFSLEMSEDQLMSRLIAIETGIETKRQRTGRLRREEWGLLARGVTDLARMPIAINDRAATSISEMRAQCKKLITNTGKGLGLVIVDYLQLMEGRGTDNRVQEISRITRSLKSLAKEIDTPIIALSQLSRGVEQRTNKRPMLSDLRESGSIEQDADLVYFLYRDEYYNPETPDRGITEIITAKNRHGSVGTVRLLFEPQFTRFRSVDNSIGGGYTGGVQWDDE